MKQYLYLIALFCLFVSCQDQNSTLTPASDCSGVTASMTDGSKILYNGVYKSEIYTLLNGSKPWRTPICSNDIKDLGKTPAFFAHDCIRDDYVNAAIQFAWAAESQWRFNSSVKAEGFAKQAIEQLNNADALCSTKPVVCSNCECSTSKIWPCANVPGSGSGTGTGTGNTASSTITFANTTFTVIDITFNGQTKQIPIGGKASFNGTPNTKAVGKASTTGRTTSGTQVGLELGWDPLDYTFPNNGGNADVELFINPNFFFLKVQNSSNSTITKLYVNYGLTAQTEDNVTIANDKKVYSLGYYKAFSNSNVRAESQNSSWSWNTLVLPFTKNQSQTVTAQ